MRNPMFVLRREADRADRRLLPESASPRPGAARFRGCRGVARHRAGRLIDAGGPIPRRFSESIADRLATAGDLV